MGRHSAPDEEDEAGDLGTAAAEPAVTAASAPADEAAPEPAPQSGTADDLAMLRGDRNLRARAAAAAVVPFFLYVIVLLVIGRFDVLLIWIWIPTVTAGVLVGALLDRAAAHRKRVSAGR